MKQILQFILKKSQIKDRTLLRIYFFLLVMMKLIHALGYGKKIKHGMKLIGCMYTDTLFTPFHLWSIQKIIKGNKLYEKLFQHLKKKF